MDEIILRCTHRTHVRAPTRRLRELDDTTKPALHTFRAVCDGLALRTAQRRRHEGHAAVRAAAEQRQIVRLERQAAPFGLDEDGPASSACIEASSLALLAIVLRRPQKRVDFDASTLPEHVVGARVHADYLCFSAPWDLSGSFLLQALGHLSLFPAL